MSLVNHQGLIRATETLNSELRKSGNLLIAGTLPVVAAENTYRNALCSVNSEPFYSSGRRVSSFKDSLALLNNYTHDFRKSEVLLIASALLVVKAENKYRNTIKMHKTLCGEEQSF